MTRCDVDTLIVGHGLAGATLTWHLRWLGQRVAVIDREESGTASRVATGLITPITGQRNTVSYRYQDFLQSASDFYRRVHSETGVQCLLAPPTWKVVDQATREQLYDRDACRPYLGADVALDSPFRPGDAIELQRAFRLDIPTFLETSRQQLVAEQAYFADTIDVVTELVTSKHGVYVPRLDMHARRVIYCQGIQACCNPGFGPLPFQPAKGEILELRAEAWQPSAVLLGDVWIVPTTSGRICIGATYQREFETSEPTDEGKVELLRGFTSLCDASPEIVGHRAAVRPIMPKRLPQIGIDRARQHGFFNGLGSKGALRAPLVAQQFALFLVRQEPVDEEFWYAPAEAGGVPERLTAQAQQLVAETVQVGDIVIDATAGNGHDTLFLSKLVGPNGNVFAVDIQSAAIARTQAKLDTHGCQNVTLMQGSHESLASMLPVDAHGGVAAVMFNLGYLPRGNKEVTTHAASTLQAIEQSLLLMKPGGILTIVAYSGHAAGHVETLALEHFSSQASTPGTYTIELPSTRWTSSRPRLYVIRTT